MRRCAVVRRPVAPALALWSAVVLWSSWAHAASDLRVRAAAGRVLATLPTERLLPDSDELYVSANGLAEALDLDRFWKPETRKLVLKAGDRRIQVTVDARLVLDGDTETLLRVPVLYKRGNVMLPIEFIERCLAPRLGEGARFDRATLDLVTGPADVDVLAVDGEPVATGGRIRVRLAHALRFRAETTSKQMLRLQVSDARLDPVAIAAERPAPLVRLVRAEQRGRDAVLYFELEPEFGLFTFRAEDDGRTIVLDLQRGAAGAAAASNRTPVLRDLVDTSTTQDSFDIVVIDPGHGGFDRGAQGAGLEEKAVTLQLAQALQPVLERELGVRVILVRNGDETLSAESRAELANRAQGDVFISLHCDAWHDPAAGGIDVSYAPLDRSAGAEAALASTRRGVTDFLPWTTAHLPYVARSQQLAELLAAELPARLDLPGRGARPAELEVLQGVAMPAVMLEVGFLTNAGDAQAMNDPEFAARLAAGVGAVLRTFRDESRAAGSGSGAPGAATPNGESR